MSRQATVLVTGAEGFIGHYLAKYLVDRGYWVRGVDIKYPEFESTAADEFEILDLRRFDECLRATRGIEEVYGLAANMGGIGFIETNKGVIVRDNTLINLHTMEAARIKRREAVPVYVQRLHLSRSPAKGSCRHSAQGRACLSGGPRRRLRLGKALHGADLPALP